MQLVTVLVLTLSLAASSQCNGGQQLSNEANVLKEKLKTALQEKDVCLKCDQSVSAVLDAYYNGTPPDDIRQAIIQSCKDQQVNTDRVCENVVNFNYDPLLYMAMNMEKITSNHVCSLVHQINGCGIDDPDLDWSVDLGDDPKPEPRHRTARRRSTARAPLTILHLTDIHYDPKYLAGGNAECNEGFCCRSDQGIPTTPDAAAGRWSDYRTCDIPWEVITDTLRFITSRHQRRNCPFHQLAQKLGTVHSAASTHTWCSSDSAQPIDYVYMTGDLVDHAVWETSQANNNATFVKVLEELKRSFGDIPVFPVIGNHEIHPVNLYAPVSVTQENVSSAWLYETIADLWSAWLPADTRETILRGGFYTVLLSRGFRVVVLNNNHCYMDNYWLIYSERDPDGQLQWLVNVLRKAEADGEKVHLLYHVPSGSNECNKRWSREFNRVINRFSATVTGQFSGHTHAEEFHIFYSHEDPPRPVNVAYVGGSLTPYADVNSNYKVYTVDADTLDILDHETWIFNLTAANLSPADTLPWERMYSFKEAYGVDSVSPEAIHNLVHRMAADDNLAQQYFRFYNLQGDPSLERGCDRECIDGLLCGIVTSDSSDLSHCGELLASYRTRSSK